MPCVGNSIRILVELHSSYHYCCYWLWSLSLAWSNALLGMIAGPVSLICFAIVTYVSAFPVSDCYRCPDSITWRQNYFYTDSVRVNLGSKSTNFFSFFFFFLVLKVQYGIRLRIYFTKIFMFYMPPDLVEWKFWKNTAMVLWFASIFELVWDWVWLLT